jgi:hypothetical protein
MSFDFVDIPQLGVRIPATFKRMAELQSIHRDATSGCLDIQQYALPACSDVPVWRRPRQNAAADMPPPGDDRSFNRTPNTGNLVSLFYGSSKIPIREFSMSFQPLDFPVTLI